MDKQVLIENAKSLIAEGNVEEALVSVVKYLSGKKAFKALHTESLHLSYLQNKTKQDETTRTISYDNAAVNYGKVREGLFNLLDCWSQ